MTGCSNRGQIKASMLVMVAVSALFGSVCRGADFELWTAAGIRWDPNDDWRFTFQEAFRFDEEGGELYYRHTAAGSRAK